MKNRLLGSLLCSSGLLLAGAALAEGADPCAIDSKVRADGTVELSNIGHTAKCEVAPGPRTPAPAAATPAPVAPPPPVAAPASTSAAAPEAGRAIADVAPTDSASTLPAGQKDPRENYRDAMLAGAPGTTAANPAVSRRYKMMDKATYQEKVLNGVPPQSDTGSAAPQ